MPTYDYECEACGHRFDAFQNMSDPALTTCPSCEEDALKRLIGGGIGVIFKGSGFYVNDSRKSGSSSSSSGSGSTTGGSDTSPAKGNDSGGTSSGGSSDGGSGAGDSTSSPDSSAKSTSKSAAAT